VVRAMEFLGKVGGADDKDGFDNRPEHANAARQKERSRDQRCRRGKVA
jgi:hypothetical protein